MACPCAKNRKPLALLADQNSSESLPEDVRRMLANCPTCREHFELLCASMNCLQQSQSQESASLQKSLWTELSHRLPEPQPPLSRYNQWKQKFVPIFSVATACLALAIVFIGTPQSKHRVYQTTIHRDTNFLPVRTNPIDYEYTPQQNLFASRLQIEPSSGQVFYLRPHPSFYDEESSQLTHDFSVPLDLQIKEQQRNHLQHLAPFE